ncbi:MAG: hypothetical protein ABIF01_02390, partial [Candidatus Micrarchaeota archaeon]
REESLASQIYLYNKLSESAYTFIPESESIKSALDGTEPQAKEAQKEAGKETTTNEKTHDLSAKKTLKETIKEEIKEGPRPLP